MSESEVREVSFEEALAEEDTPEEVAATPRPRPQPRVENDTPVAEPVSEPQSESQESDPEEDLEILVPKVAAKVWTIGEGEIARTYTQQELSVIGFAQWTGLVGEFLDKAMSGENALSLNSLLSPPQIRTPGRLSIQDFQDADVFIHAVGKLVQFAPEFMSKSVCIWLGVPDYEWELVDDLMKRSPQNGGMSFDMFQEILEIFIDQNYNEINRFFRTRQQQIRARWQARAKEASESRSSKR